MYPWFMFGFDSRKEIATEERRMNGKRTRQVVALEEKRITGIMRRQEKELTPYIYIYI
jgi:hypothetical protein